MKFLPSRTAVTLRTHLVALAAVLAPGIAALADDPWKPWVEPDFPFFSSALDLRPQMPKDSIPWNITPRGIILNLGHDCWACFDTDLLRVSAIWSGKGVTEDSLAPLSYQNKPLKTVGGQSNLAKPDGKVWLMNGVYPGWQVGEKVSLEDPREPQPSPEEPGRGPISSEVGQFKAVRLSGTAAVLQYTVAGAGVLESMSVGEENGKRVVRRRVLLMPCAKPVTLLVGRTLNADGNDREKQFLSDFAKGGVSLAIVDGVTVLRVPPQETAIELTITVQENGIGISTGPVEWPPLNQPSVARWPQEVVTKATLSTSNDAYVVDEIPLPLENPWRRNVRLADLAEVLLEAAYDPHIAIHRHPRRRVARADEHRDSRRANLCL